MKTSRQQTVEPATFFVGTNKGHVYMISDKSRRICSVDGSIARILHSYDCDILIVVTAANMMTQYNLQQIQTQSEALTAIHSVRWNTFIGEQRKGCVDVPSKGKLSGRPADSDFTLIGTNLFAYVTGESAIHMMDLASSDNLLLKLNQEMGYGTKDVLISLSYSEMKGIQCLLFLRRLYERSLCPSGIIAAGTNRGSIAFWVYNPNQRTADAEKHWTLQRAKTICNEVAVRKLKVASTQRAWTSLLCSSFAS